MNNAIMKAIVKKDLTSMLSSPKTWIPMILVSVLLCIILPAALSYAGTYTEVFDVRKYEELERILQQLINTLPNGEIKSNLQQLNEMGHKFSYFVTNFVLISVFLMVTIINSMVSATSSFVGEKERGTLETLLFAPLSIKELFAAKILSSFIPSIVITYMSYLVSFLVLNAINYPELKTLVLFNGMWLVLMIWLVPIIVLFNVLLNVFVSARVKTYQEAQQFGGLFVLPMIGLIVGQTTGLFFINTQLLFFAGLILLAVDIVLFFLLVTYNKRNSLFEKQIH